MKKIMNKHTIIGFAVGALAGSAATYFIMKKRTEKTVNDAIAHTVSVLIRPETGEIIIPSEAVNDIPESSDETVEEEEDDDLPFTDDESPPEEGDNVDYSDPRVGKNYWVPEEGPESVFDPAIDDPEWAGEFRTPHTQTPFIDVMEYLTYKYPNGRRTAQARAIAKDPYWPPDCRTETLAYQERMSMPPRLAHDVFYDFPLDFARFDEHVLIQYADNIVADENDYVVRFGPDILQSAYCSWARGPYYILHPRRQVLIKMIPDKRTYREATGIIPPDVYHPHRPGKWKHDPEKSFWEQFDMDICHDSVFVCDAKDRDFTTEGMDVHELIVYDNGYFINEEDGTGWRLRMLWDKVVERNIDYRMCELDDYYVVDPVANRAYHIVRKMKRFPAYEYLERYYGTPACDEWLFWFTRDFPDEVYRYHQRHGLLNDEGKVSYAYM